MTTQPRAAARRQARGLQAGCGGCIGHHSAADSATAKTSGLAGHLVPGTGFSAGYAASSWLCAQRIMMIPPWT